MIISCRQPGNDERCILNITKAEMARRLKTSRTRIDRLLDPANASITLTTMAKFAYLLGKRIDISLR